MKSILVPLVLLFAAASGFSIGPQVVGSSHAEDGYTYKDLMVDVVVSPVEDGRLWVNAEHSYLLLFSERDKLLDLVQGAVKKIDIATANKTTISFVQELGNFRTDEGAHVSVAFQTDGYQSSYAVVRIMDDGNYDFLMLNRKDSMDFLNVLGNAHSLIDDYQRQAALFK
jgi:hypothetical protein